MGAGKDAACVVLPGFYPSVEPLVEAGALSDQTLHELATTQPEP
jgi:hypothetical protein